jgi:two-component system sensor histidine kinase PilS (NtrC family)
VAGPAPAEARLRGRRLIAARTLLAGVLAGAALLLRARGSLPFPLAPVLAVAGAAGVWSLAWLGLTGRAGAPRRGLVVQFLGDLLLETALLHFTGGIWSPFAFIYVFSIFGAATLGGRQASFLTALGASLLYGLVGLTEVYRLPLPLGVAPPAALPERAAAATLQVAGNITAFLVVAFLSSNLAERLQEARRRLEETGVDLRKLQTLHRHVVANIPSGVMTLDLQGRIVSFNAAAESITGYRFEEVRDRPWDRTLFAAMPGLGASLAGRGTGLGKPIEAEVVRRDGASIPIEAACSPLRGDEGELLGLVVVFDDLTEKRGLEARLRRADRLAAVGQLAAGIAHEIRNPLAAISGAIQVLAEDVPRGGLNRDLLEIVLREADRLKLVTGQFLDFARPMVERPCRLPEIIRETVTLVERSRDRHAASQVRVVEPPGPMEALGDADQLRQVFWNISLNALEAMQAGGRLTIRFEAEGDDGVSVAFEDTGPGIAPADRERIFEPFFTTKGGGTGLGLYIARKIVESHGGAIRVGPAPGGGAAVRVSLRRAQVTAGAARS